MDEFRITTANDKVYLLALIFASYTGTLSPEIISGTKTKFYQLSDDQQIAKAMSTTADVRKAIAAKVHTLANFDYNYGDLNKYKLPETLLEFNNMYKYISTSGSTYSNALRSVYGPFITNVSDIIKSLS